MVLQNCEIRRCVLRLFDSLLYFLSTLGHEYICWIVQSDDLLGVSIIAFSSITSIISYHLWQTSRVYVSTKVSSACFPRRSCGFDGLCLISS